MGRRAALLLVLASCVAAQDELTPAHRAFLEKLSDAAIERTTHAVRYDPTYVRIPYPGGDVPLSSGVCTDEVIRAYRTIGIDLQKEVHEDMAANFSAYPHRSKWLLAKTDTNIDHRRVPNLMAFFSRKGESRPLTTRAEAYTPGDLVAWDLGEGVLHIGIVVNKRSAVSGRFMIVHNIGRGPKMEDVLFHWRVIGHYRYFGS
jgi:hypothetical protein